MPARALRARTVPFVDERISVRGTAFELLLGLVVYAEVITA
jgi:hypothetical protein